MPLTYLGYKLPRRSEVVFGIAALAVLIVIGDTVSWLAGRSIVDRFQTDIYQAAQNANLLPLLLIAITVFIPVTEESLFRGFLFRGWLRSPRDAWPVIVMTAGLFAVIHVQYDWFLIGQVFAFGRAVRMDALGIRLDHSDHAAARPGQSGRHDRDDIDHEQLTRRRRYLRATRRCER